MDIFNKTDTFENSRLYSNGARSPEATNIQLRASGKNAPLDTSDIVY